MNIRQLAEADLAFTLEDSVTGFGWAVSLTDPAGVSFNLTVQSSDIGLMIDPDTGAAVSGRTAAVVGRISTLNAVGAAVPDGEASRNAMPWVVEFEDINGQAYKFKVEYTDRDRTLGTITMRLGLLK